MGISLVLQRKINEKINGNFRTVPAAFTWGSAFCVLKDTLENVSPIWLLAFRFLLAGIIMTLVCIPRMKKMSIRTLKRGIIMGIVLYFEFLFFTVGLQYTTSSKSSFIIGSYVAILPLIYLGDPREKAAEGGYSGGTCLYCRTWIYFAWKF